MSLFKLKGAKLKHKILLIQLSFLIIAFLYALGYPNTGRIPMGDQVFNYLRLKEVSLDVLHGQFPQFNSYIGTVLGSSVNSFYPWFLMLPLTLFMYILPPIEWWGFVVGVGMFVGLETMYLSAMTVYHNRKHSALLAMIYGLSTITFSIVYGQCDISSFYAIMLSPIAFFGWVHWIKNGKWRMLATGMALLSIAHLPDTLIMGLGLTGLTLMFISKLSKEKIINALKAIGIFMLISAIIWLPAVILATTNHIYLPSDGGRKMIGASQRPLIFKPIIQYLIPEVMNMWGITDVLSLVFSFIFWKSLSHTQKKFTLAGLFIIILNIHPIAIFLTTQTPLKALQFFHRTCFFSHLLFSIVLVDIAFNILAKRWERKNIRRFFVIIISLMTSAILIGFGEIYITTAGHHKKDVAKSFATFNYAQERKSNRSPKHGVRHHFIYDNKDLSSNKGLHYIPSVYPDYYPYDNLLYSKKMNGTILNMPNVTPHNYQKNLNGMLFDTKQSKTYTLPIVVFRHQNYAIKVNDKAVHFMTQRNRIRVKLHKGKNVVTVHTPIMWYRYVAMLMTATGLLILVLPVIKKRRRHV